MVRLADYPALSEFVRPLASGGWQVLILAQPGAKKTECMPVHDGRLKVRVMAPALENKANKVLLEFMAGALRLPVSRLSLSGGEKNRRKVITIRDGANPDWEALYKIIPV